MLEFFGDPISYGGLTVTAKIYGNGSQVGSNISCIESPTVPGYYTGTVPGSVTAGKYIVGFYNNNSLIGSGILDWDGTEEIDIESLVNELHMLEGLHNNNPLVVTQTTRTAGGINQSISTNINGDVTVARV